MSNNCLVIMTFGKQQYAETPIRKLALPYGAPDRSRYLRQYCTEEAISIIEQGYEGIGYYFLRVIKEGENYLIPLRKLQIQRAEILVSERVLIEYNIADYAWSDANPAEIFKDFRQLFEIERTSDKEILVFAGSRSILSSLIKTGKDMNSWGKAIKPIKELILNTSVMDADTKYPLLTCSILVDDKKGSRVTRYDKDGIIVNSNTGYRIKLSLDSVKDVSGFVLPVEMKVDESFLTCIKPRDKFVSTYDTPELFFITKNMDHPAQTEAVITFLPMGSLFFTPNTELKLKLTVRRWIRRSFYLIFAAGVILATLADYFIRGEKLGGSDLAFILLAVGAGAALTVFALSKIKG